LLPNPVARFFFVCHFLCSHEYKQVHVVVLEFHCHLAQQAQHPTLIYRQRILHSVATYDLELIIAYALYNKICVCVLTM